MSPEKGVNHVDETDDLMSNEQHIIHQIIRHSIIRLDIEHKGRSGCTRLISTDTMFSLQSALMNAIVLSTVLSRSSIIWTNTTHYKS